MGLFSKRVSKGVVSSKCSNMLDHCKRARIYRLILWEFLRPRVPDDIGRS